MQIDWLTVAAQTVNFLVLVWLLRRYLYRPILDAVERRQRMVAERLEEAAAAKEEASRRALALQVERERFDKKRDQLLAQAREAAEKTRQSLEDEARQAVADERQRWLDEVEADRDIFLSAVRTKAGAHFLDFARRALRGLADTDLESQFAARFVEKLAGLDDQTRRRFAEMARGRIRVTSRFDLPDAQREALRQGIATVLGGPVEIDFESDTAGATGIEMRCDGQTIAWTIDTWLDDLEAAIAADLDAGAAGARITP